MPSLRSRLIYRVLKIQKQPFDPDKSVQQQRASLEKQVKRVPMPRNVDVQPIAIGNLPAEWLRPVGVNDDRVVLYLHGGYTMGSSSGLSTAAQKYSRRLRRDSPIALFGKTVLFAGGST